MEREGPSVNQSSERLCLRSGKSRETHHPPDPPSIFSKRLLKARMKEPTVVANSLRLAFPDTPLLLEDASTHTGGDGVMRRGQRCWLSMEEGTRGAGAGAGLCCDPVNQGSDPSLHPNVRHRHGCQTPQTARLIGVPLTCWCVTGWSGSQWRHRHCPHPRHPWRPHGPCASCGRARPRPPPSRTLPCHVNHIHRVLSAQHGSPHIPSQCQGILSGSAPFTHHTRPCTDSTSH